MSAGNTGGNALGNIVIVLVLLAVALALVILVRGVPQPPFPAAGTAGAQVPESNYGDKPNVSVTGLEERIHELVNLERARAGLAPLSWDENLSAIALGHSQDMALHEYFGHNGTAGDTPTDRALRSGYNCTKYYADYYTYGIGENLFKNNLYDSIEYYDSVPVRYDWNSQEKIAEVTVAGWMNSTEHRDNILQPNYDREGIGIVIAKNDAVYITEDFC